MAIAGCPDSDTLEQRLQNELWPLLKVDVIDLDAPISSELRKEINTQGKVLYEKV